MLGFVSLLGFNSHAQVRIDTFKVNGDIDKYYVVSFFDGGWLSNVATDLEIGRASTNTDGSNSGSMIGKFRFHVGNSVHGAGFIDGDLRQSNLVTPSKGFFVGGWRDVSEDNSAATIVIWLRGNTTYFYKSSFPVAPRVYDSTHVYDGTLFSKNYKPSGDAVGGSIGLTLSIGEGGVGLAQIVDGVAGLIRGDDGTGHQALHSVGSLPGLIATGAGIPGAEIIDAAAQLGPMAAQKGIIKETGNAVKEVVHASSPGTFTVAALGAYDTGNDLLGAWMAGWTLAAKDDGQKATTAPAVKGPSPSPAKRSEKQKEDKQAEPQKQLSKKEVKAIADFIKGFDNR